jgi:hypothetical protein
VTSFTKSTWSRTTFCLLLLRSTIILSPRGFVIALTNLLRNWSLNIWSSLPCKQWGHCWQEIPIDSFPALLLELHRSLETIHSLTKDRKAKEDRHRRLNKNVYIIRNKGKPGQRRSETFPNLCSHCRQRVDLKLSKCHGIVTPIRTINDVPTGWYFAWKSLLLDGLLGSMAKQNCTAGNKTAR